jgi:two-component system, NtrC family, response regulator HydG
MPNVRVLIVDDNAATAHTLSEGLAQESYSLEVARTGSVALSTVERLACDIVICDVRMAGMGDMELLDRLKRIDPMLPVILLTATSTISEAVDAIKHGAFQYLAKPCNLVELRGFVAQATGEGQRHDSVRPPGLEGRHASGKLVQTSPAMRALAETIALVAVSKAPVLIVGETGIGKERVARAIHASGPRRDRPFVAVNTSAIPELLLESEIFGHVRGAFTGATQTRKGLLIEAEGGTVLLDEIGDMPLALQPKLLRVLQFGEIRPVGSDRLTHVDVRIIAATHRNLDVLVQEGLFRDDLRYRLNVIPLVVPPLRERREDIPQLATHFLEQARERSPMSPVKSISDEAMSVLQKAAWLGNVRELENTIERLVVLGQDTMIVPRDLAFLDAGTRGQPWPSGTEDIWTLKQMNEQYLAWVLVQTGGDKVSAARILGMDLSTLYRWQRAAVGPSNGNGSA